MRTVRSVARSRNQPKSLAFLIVVVALVLLVAFCARVNASPPPDLSFPDDDAVDMDIDVDRAGPNSLSDSPDSRTAGIQGACDCDPATVTRIAATAPPLPAIIAAAQRAAGMGSNPTPSWRRRSRWSALIPFLSTRIGNSESWRDTYDPALAATTTPPTLSHAVTWDVRVGWRLDKLLYDANEPRFEAFERTRRRDRRMLAAQASRVYFTWLRAAIAADRDPRWQVRVAEATAQLDALTDGWFSNELAAQ